MVKRKMEGTQTMTVDTKNFIEWALHWKDLDEVWKMMNYKGVGSGES